MIITVSRWWLVCLCSTAVLLLSGCDNTDYKARIQQENDRANPNGNKFTCLAVGDVTKNMYPYTIHYMAGYSDNLHYRDPIYVNHKLNKRLALFAQEGLFSQALVGYDGELPLYRYDLTDEGRKYVDWGAGGTNFCFGRLVVDGIDEIRNDQNGIGGGNMRTVSFYFHLENLPNFLKNEEIFNSYWVADDLPNKKMIQGKQVLTSHEYSVSSDGRLRLLAGSSGGYKL